MPSRRFFIPLLSLKSQRRRKNQFVCERLTMGGRVTARPPWGPVSYPCSLPTMPNSPSRTAHTMMYGHAI